MDDDGGMWRKMMVGMMVNDGRMSEMIGKMMVRKKNDGRMMVNDGEMDDDGDEMMAE